MATVTDFELPIFDEFDEDNIYSEKLTVTPQMAAEWLGRNSRNRNQSDFHVKDQSANMKAGAFKLNGETIKFAFDGTVLDGQTRLEACVESGVTFQTFIVWGLDYEAQDTVDIGRKRTLAHALEIRRMPNSTITSSTANLVWAYYNRTITKKARRERNPSHPVALAFIEENEKDLHEALSMASGLIVQVPFVRSTAAALYYILSHAAEDIEDVSDFWARLSSGEHQVDTDPIWKLRERIKIDRKYRPDTIMALALGIKAWNYYLDDKGIDLLVWKPTKEKYPVAMTKGASKSD